METLLLREIEKDGIWPFPKIKRGAGPTIFPRRKLLPASISEVYDTFLDAKNAIDEKKLLGEIIRVRNTNKDIKEEILDPEYYENELDAIFVKESIEEDNDDFQILANVRDISCFEKKEKTVKMFFLSDRERNSYIHKMEEDGYFLESVLLEEEAKKEEFSYSFVYDDLEEARSSLTLLENNYHTLGKIMVLPSGFYEISLKTTVTSKEKLYILDAIVSKQEEKHIYEVLIEKIEKGYDYMIQY